MRLIIKYSFVIVILCSVLPLLAQNTTTLTAFKEANEAYAKKDFATAIRLYENLAQQNKANADIAYNLANTYSQTKQIGKAVLNYERALCYNPYMQDAAHNLAIINTWRKDDIEPIYDFFLIRWAKAIRNALSSNTWAVIGLVLLFTMAGGMGFTLLSKNNLFKKRGFFVAVTALILSFIPFWCAYETLQLEQHSGFAIIQSAEVSLHSAPDVESGEVMPLHEGTKIEILDQINEWIKVELINGEQGWLPLSVIEEI